MRASKFLAAVIAFISVLLIAAGRPTPTHSPALSTQSSADDLIIDIGRGPVTVHLPPSYDPDVPMPLVLLLHGYGGWGDQVEAYLQFQLLSDEYGFIYAHPDGSEDLLGAQFWNATNACCAFFSFPDDSGYLRALIDAIKDAANVDGQRVYFVGHSNGGFMSYRMACDHSDAVAAIVSIAGASYKQAADCAPAQPVHVLQVHGTADTVVQFNGGCFLACYPGARNSVRQWANFDGCDLVPDLSAPPLDLDASISGDETRVAKLESGCDPGGSATLWAIQDGSHAPAFNDAFGDLVIAFLFAHSKP